MNRSKDQLLQDLDPTRPETIQALIDLHRQMFGGFRMADGDDKDGAGKDGASNDDADKGHSAGEGEDDEKDLGEAGKKAIRSEREARKALERKVAELEANRVDPKKLAEALGVKTEGDKTSATDVATKAMERIDKLERDNLLLRVAAKHKITDEDDLELLKGITDESAMDKLAARLASASRDGDDSEKDKKDKRRPAPDRSQGRGSDGSSRPSSVKAVQEERRAAREAKK